MVVYLFILEMKSRCRIVDPRECNSNFKMSKSDIRLQDLNSIHATRVYIRSSSESNDNNNSNNNLIIVVVVISVSDSGATRR